MISVDEISLGCSYPIVVAVNATNRKQIVSELTKEEYIIIFDVINKVKWHMGSKRI